MMVNMSGTDIKKLFDNPKDEGEVDGQLRLVEILVNTARQADLESVVQNLIRHCKSRGFLVQLIQAHCALSRIYYHQVPKRASFRGSRRSIASHSDASSIPHLSLHGRMLKTSRELSFYYHDYGRPGAVR